MRPSVFFILLKSVNYGVPSFVQLIVDGVGVQPFRHILDGVHLYFTFLAVGVAGGAFVLHFRLFLKEQIVDM